MEWAYNNNPLTLPPHPLQNEHIISVFRSRDASIFGPSLPSAGPGVHNQSASSDTDGSAWP